MAQSAQLIFLSYTLQNYDGSTYTYSMLRRDAYKEGTVTGTSSVLQSGSTISSYDVNNNLVAVTDATKPANIDEKGDRFLFLCASLAHWQP